MAPGGTDELGGLFHALLAGSLLLHLTGAAADAVWRVQSTSALETGLFVAAALVNALIFVAVPTSFYASFGDRVPGVDTGSREFRNAVAPLNLPSEEVPPEVRAAAKEASTEAVHLAMLVGAGLTAAVRLHAG